MQHLIKSYTLPGGEVVTELTQELRKRYRFDVSTSIVEAAIIEIVSRIPLQFIINVDHRGWVSVQISSS